MVHPKGKKTETESDSDAGQKYQAPFGRPVMPCGSSGRPPGAGGSGGVASSSWGDRQNLGAAVDSMLSKLSTLRQSSSHNKPAELFRKDLISAMKLADSEILNQDDYYEISDCWRQDWEKGVQVPVNPEILHQPSARKVEVKGPQTPLYDFRMPKKYLHSAEDDTYRHGHHELTGMQQLAEQVVRYDLDDQDVAWLDRINQNRQIMGDLTIQEWTMERVLEALETECHERLSETIKNSEGLGIEYDEDVICDVCRSPDSEETNEMVFCDNCDLCLHQACYGIQTIPDGSWLCRPCSLGLQPACILCPNKGGAMKSTKSGTKWCHVSCALWIPEVSIGCVEKMEPITKISQVPSSRWELICCICRERQGACIQCCVKSCKTSFHVTCAFNENLDMKTLLGDEHEEVKLKAYCPKHSRGNVDSLGLPVPVPCSPRKQYTEEEKKNLRQKRIQQIEEEFYTCVDVTEICGKLSVCDDVVRDVYEYWKLKRRANFNRPLLMARREEADLLSRQQEDALIAKMKMFVHLRQDLERVRNLCYMVSRREKTRRSLYSMKEQIFSKQEELVMSETVVSSREMARILALNHAPDPYDQPKLILQTSRRFDQDDVTESVDDVSDDVIKGGSLRKNGLVERMRGGCAMAGMSGADRLPASDRVSTSPESDSSSSGDRPRDPRLRVTSPRHPRLASPPGLPRLASPPRDPRLSGRKQESRTSLSPQDARLSSPRRGRGRPRTRPANGLDARTSRTGPRAPEPRTESSDAESVTREQQDITANMLTLAGLTVRVKGLKRVTRLPSLKHRSRDAKPSLTSQSNDMTSDSDSKSTTHRDSRASSRSRDYKVTLDGTGTSNDPRMASLDCNVVLDNCVTSPYVDQSVKTMRSSHSDCKLRPSNSEPRPSQSERTLRPAPRNLLEHFQKVSEDSPKESKHEDRTRDKHVDKLRDRTRDEPRDRTRDEPRDRTRDEPRDVKSENRTGEPRTRDEHEKSDGTSTIKPRDKHVVSSRSRDKHVVDKTRDSKACDKHVVDRTRDKPVDTSNSKDHKMDDLKIVLTRDRIRDSKRTDRSERIRVKSGDSNCELDSKSQSRSVEKSRCEESVKDRTSIAAPSQSVPELASPPADERRVEPLRVNLGRRLELCHDDSSSDSSEPPSSNSTMNGYTRRRGKRKHSSPSKKHHHSPKHRSRHHSPVKCTLISPGKLKLTLTDQVKVEPVKKSELCEKFISDSSTSPYKNSLKSKSDTKSDRRSKHKDEGSVKISKSELVQPAKSESKENTALRSPKTTVSVAELLKLRRSRKLIGVEVDSDSGESGAKRSRTSVAADSDSDCSRAGKQQHRRSHHS